MENHIEKRKQIINVKNEDIEIEANALIDGRTNEMIFDMALDEKAINQAFDKYRNKHDIISPNEITNLREKLDISQKTLSKLTGIGPASIARYEKGSIPTKSANIILKKLMRDNSFACVR